MITNSPAQIREYGTVSSKNEREFKTLEKESLQPFELKIRSEDLRREDVDLTLQHGSTKSII